MMREGDLLVLFSTPESSDMGGAGRFYQNRDFLYLTGFPEPDSALVIAAGDPKPYKLFIRPRNPDEEKWTGRRYGLEGALETWGADESFEISRLESALADLMVGKKRIYYRLGKNPEQDQLILRVMTHLRRNQRPENIPSVIMDSAELLHPLRLIKDEREIAVMRESASIAVRAFQHVMSEIKVGMYEYQAEAMLEEVYRFHGCEGPSFPTISAAGANATYLHYQENSKKIEPGEFLLLDSGCLYRGYASDITRTFMPEDQPLSPQQKTLYEAVLKVQKVMIQAVRPGKSLCALNQLCQREIALKLIELGFVKGDLDEVLSENKHKEYFPHRLGHWLGSDVHDAGSYGMENPDLALAPGMLLTIEPGIYIPEEAEGPAAPFAGIGVRIEDDLLVTDEGNENLTIDLPK